MNASLDDLHALADTVVSAILNGVYQGLLLTAAAALGLLFLRRANAATRHLITGIMLVVVAALPILHGLRSAWPQAARSMAPPQEPVPTTERSALALKEAHRIPVLMPPRARIEPPSTATLPEPIDPKSWPEWPLTVDPVPRPGDAPPLTPFVAPTSAPEASVASAPLLRAPLILIPSLPQGWTLGLLGLWVVLAGVRLVVLAGQYRALRRIKRLSEPAPEDLEAMFASVRGEMGVRRPARLRISAALGSPVVAGLGHPTVLVPRALLGRLSDAEWRHILRHEVGHVCRRDDWTNLAQQLIRSVLFFHPAIWWWSRRLEMEREIACDDFVLAQAGRPEGYALFLTEFAGRQRERHWSAAPAAWSHKSQLKERIGMILDETRNRSTRLLRLRTAVMLSTILLLTALAWQLGPRIALAQDSLGSAPPVARNVPAPVSEDSQPAVEAKEPAALPAPDAPPPPPAPKPALVPALAPVADRFGSDTTPREDSGRGTTVILKNIESDASAPRQKSREGRTSVSFGELKAGATTISHPRPRLADGSTTAEIDDGDILHRLERLEKLVHTLVEQGRRSVEYKSAQGLVQPGSRDAFEGSTLGGGFGRATPVPKQEIFRDASEDLLHRHERELDVAARALERSEHELNAVRNRNLERRMSIDQRKVLEAQRSALQEQLRAIDQQIKELELQREKEYRLEEQLNF